MKLELANSYHHDNFISVYYSNVEEATLAVENGEAWGVVSVGGNFSSSLYEVNIFQILKKEALFFFRAIINKALFCFVVIQRIVNRPELGDDTWDIEIDKSVYEESSIKVKMDITNQHIAFTLQVKFVEAFEKFGKQLVINVPLNIYFV